MYNDEDAVNAIDVMIAEVEDAVHGEYKDFEVVEALEKVRDMVVADRAKWIDRLIRKIEAHDINQYIEPDVAAHAMWDIITIIKEEKGKCKKMKEKET